MDIIETEQKLSEEPRAVTYYASTLKALDKMGIIPEIKKAGFVSAGFAGANLSDMMDRAVIEWVMLSVEDLFQDGSGVRATTRRGDMDTETTFQASYLGGADGG